MGAAIVMGGNEPGGCLMLSDRAGAVRACAGPGGEILMPQDTHKGRRVGRAFFRVNESFPSLLLVPKLHLGTHGSAQLHGADRRSAWSGDGSICEWLMRPEKLEGNRRAKCRSESEPSAMLSP